MSFFKFLRRIFCFLLLIFSMVSVFAQEVRDQRGQWNEDQAWDWEQKVGIINGFNAPSIPYPGMERTEILKKAASLGFNSVRIWIPPGAESGAEFLQTILDEASEYNMTVSPVLRTDHYFDIKDEAEAEKAIREYLANTVGKFKDDPRIIFWDVANEPALTYSFEGKAWEKEGLAEIDLVKNIVRWARELNPVQPITTSALFLTEHIYEENKVHGALKELAAMSDVHNFHLYDLSVNRMKAIDDMIALLKSLGNRPIICTEIVARTRGGTFARSLTALSKYHIHFYNWGMYTSDSNWDVAWGLSSFEPYEPWFHDVLHPDGYPYDWRDLEWVRNFHFARDGEQTDPGAEVTERWNKWRAWKWMANGPIKGMCLNLKGDMVALKNQLSQAGSSGYNNVSVKFDIHEWKLNENKYYAKIDSLLKYAEGRNMGVMPVLLTYADAGMSTELIDGYVSGLIGKYGFDSRVIAWELITKPDRLEFAKSQLTNFIGFVFRIARFEFPNQPLTATPFARVEKFDPGFDYNRELIHGHRGGWGKVRFSTPFDPELCNYVWSLSDIISIESDMAMPETGWLLSIANRYGRPVVCSSWKPPSPLTSAETLELFSKNKVYWFNDSDNVSSQLIDAFDFSRISTPRR